MLLKSMYFLDKNYGLALDGKPWVIQKIGTCNKVVGTCILSLKIKSYDWVALIRFSLFTSITIFSNINIFFSFFNILVDIQV